MRMAHALQASTKRSWQQNMWARILRCTLQHIRRQSYSSCSISPTTSTSTVFLNGNVTVHCVHSIPVHGAVNCNLACGSIPASPQVTPLYDPCATGSRLGVPVAELTACEPQLLVGISGLHMHTLCEQYTTDLISTVAALEKQATPLLASPAIRYLNLGGGHWITKPDYDRGALVELILRLKQQYGVQVYLEPGEAWCIHTGVLRSQVLDIFEAAGHSHAILDVSVSAHMPDVLEMPYRPCVFCTVPFSSDASLQQPAVCLPEEFYHAAGVAGELPHTYRLGARTCLAGDVLGDFSFPRSLAVGDTIIMDDMAHYTIVKTTHFNGVPHPDIALLLPDNSIRTVRHFTFRDFADRLG